MRSLFTAIVVVAATAAHAEAALVVVGEGVRGADLQTVEAAVRAASPPLLPADTTNTKIAAAQSHGVRCDARTVDCLVQLGVVCGADTVLLAEVSAQDKSQKLALTVVDVGEGKAKKRAVGDASKAADVVASLDRSDAKQTRLEVRAADPSTKVAIDDGTPQSAPFVRTDVPAGPHKLRVSLTGHEPTIVDVDVRLGEATIVKAVPGAAHNAQVVTVATPDAPVAAAPAPSSSGPLLIGGAVVAVVGVGAAVIGSVPYIERASSGSTLLALEGKTTAGNIDAAAISAARKTYDDAGSAMQSWAPALLAGGALVCGVGAGLLGAALVE